MQMQVRGYLLLSIAVFLYSINDLFVSNKGNIKIKDLTLRCSWFMARSPISGARHAPVHKHLVECAPVLPGRPFLQNPQLTSGQKPFLRSTFPLSFAIPL